MLQTINNTLPKESGIYKISCTASNKYYIGSAVNMRARAAKHIHDFKRNSHTNKKLQNTYNKYGAFIFEVLELCSISDLLVREQAHFDIVPDWGLCLNICKVAGNTLGQDVWSGRVHTSKTKEQMKRNAALSGVTGGKHPTSVQIVKYTLDGKFVELFESATLAAASIGCPNTNIIACAKGKRKSRGGFQWKYKQDNYLDDIPPVVWNKLVINFKNKYDEQSGYLQRLAHTQLSAI